MTNITNKPQYGQQVGVIQNGVVYFTDEFNRFIDEVVQNSDVVEWDRVDFTGSNLTDIETRNHADLQNVLEADPGNSDTTRDKHVSNNDTRLWTQHLALEVAHGSNGDIVGDEDWATTLRGGVVKLAVAVADASNSGVSVTSPNVSAAPAAYTQAWGAEVVALSNEMKGDINALVTDVNAAIDQLNDLMQSLRDALQLQP